MKGAEKVKKSNFQAGLVYLIIGIVCLVIALDFGTKLESILYGFAGAGIGSGAVSLWKYYYWSRPENRERYQAKIEQERIELHDERKIILRDKSGRYAYLIGLIVISASVVIFSIIGSLNVIEDYTLIISYLAGFFVFQYIIGILIFNHLNKKN